MEYEFAKKALKVIVTNFLSGAQKKEWEQSVSEFLIEHTSEKTATVIIDFLGRKQNELANALSSKNMEKMHINTENTAYVSAEIRDLLNQIEDVENLVRRSEYIEKNLKELLWKEYAAYKNGHIENKSDIQKCMDIVARALIKIQFDSDLFEKNTLIELCNSMLSVKELTGNLQTSFNRMEENLTAFKERGEKAFDIIETLGGQAQLRSVSATPESGFVSANKKADYIKIWNSNLFLSTPERGNPLTLREAFIMPDYFLRATAGELIKKEPLDQIIHKFVSFPRTSSMLITGVPGIGKSSITSWIANKYKDHKELIILRFRDWSAEELENGLLNAICTTLHCHEKYMDGKILILEGFDEIKALDIGNELLSSFRSDLRDFHGLRCIVTSRPAYINAKIFDNVIELRVFDIKRISLFYETVMGEKLLQVNKIENNLDVLGIPVILYLALMSGVKIDENPTKPELYYRIFGETGSIFDKFYDGQSEYSEGSQLLRNPDNIKKYLDFLCNVAKKMYDKDDEILNKGELEIPKLEFQNRQINILEFPIKHFFEETATKIEFVHRSIFEYFVSEYFYKLLKEAIDSNVTPESLAGALGEWLAQHNNFSADIQEFLRYRIQSTLTDRYDAVLEAFHTMLRDGMTCHMGRGSRWNMLEREIILFSKMLNLLHFWGCSVYKIRSEKLAYFLGQSGDCLFNLKGMDLEDARLENTVLCKSDLSLANLKNVNLSTANLKEAVLEDAQLQEAVLNNANLIGADLTNADLSSAKLQGTNLTRAVMPGAILQNAVLNDAIFKYTNLQKANMVNTFWKNTSLFGAKLQYADLRGCDLTSVDLRRANLDGAILSWADLRGVDFHKVTFSLETNLDNAKIKGAIFYVEQLDILKQICDLSAVKIYVRTADYIELL